MVIKCDVCENEITDGSKVPMWIVIAGFNIDEGQFNLDICRNCLVNKGREILKILEDNKDDYD